MVRSSTEWSSTFYIGATLWLLTCIWLIQNELAVIAVLGSAFLALYAFGLRDKFASETTPSAYSVFNEDGRAIAGGLTGEQVDRQLRGGCSVATDTSTSSTNNSGSANTKATSRKIIENSPSTKVSADQRLRRRQAAAEAAERRVQRT